MHQKIFIASGNIGKIKEIREILKPGKGFRIISPENFGICIDAEEDGNSLEENAFKKAKINYEVLEMPVISDDTGLFTDALNGEPGIYSARYAGKNSSYSDNCRKLLSEMSNIPMPKRTARFECVICLYINEKEYYFFKGICNGVIINECRGENGFGYDPMFVPEGYDKTFAELPDSVKNKISHRASALLKLREFSGSYFQ